MANKNLGQAGDLLAKNKAWADGKVAQDANFFQSQLNSQKPKYLWLGCADSRVSTELITGVNPGEIFVHRNIANQIIHTDFNSLSVMHYAIEHLKVEHVIVCGHYNCGGVIAALSDGKFGFVDNWLRHLKDLAAQHTKELNALAPADRPQRMVELNVMHQVVHVAESTFVQQAWEKGQPLTIHGWVYSLADGKLKDLNVSLKGGDVAGLREKLAK